MHKPKRILFSQNLPIDFDKSPYADIQKNYNVTIDFYKFFQINDVSVDDFRKSRINISNYSSFIFTSKNAIDHFFRIAKELKITKMPLGTNYFCINATTAHYLQKYTTCRRRRVFFSPKGDPNELITEIINHESDKFLFPSAIDSSNNQLIRLLDKAEINYTKAEVFTISFADVSQVIDLYEYDIVVFFSPYGIQTLLHSYPKFKQGKLVIGALGLGVVKAAQEAGIDVQIIAPTKEHPSIFSAVDDYLSKLIGRKR